MSSAGFAEEFGDSQTNIDGAAIARIDGGLGRVVQQPIENLLKLVEGNQTVLPQQHGEGIARFFVLQGDREFVAGNGEFF